MRAILLAVRAAACMPFATASDRLFYSADRFRFMVPRQPDGADPRNYHKPTTNPPEADQSSGSFPNCARTAAPPRVAQCPDSAASDRRFRFGTDHLPLVQSTSTVRVSAWSRGDRARRACGHSVSGGQPNDDENRVVLLVAPVHGGHRRPWIHRKTLGLHVRGRARVVTRLRFLARGAASEMGDIVEGRAVGEFPPLVAVLVLGVNGQHGRHVAVARDEVFPRSQRKGRLLHDQAVFLQPPVLRVEFPLCRRYAAVRLQLRVMVQLASARAWVLVPETPGLRAVAGGGPGFSQRRDELRLDALELREVYACRVNRLLQAGGQHEGSYGQEPAAHGRHEVADMHAIPPWTT